MLETMNGWVENLGQVGIMDSEVGRDIKNWLVRSNAVIHHYKIRQKTSAAH